MISAHEIMKYLRTNIMFLILTSICIIVYSIMILSLDLTIQGTGFSPFKIWTPLQTTSFAIMGILCLFISILIDERERSIDVKWLIFLIPLMLLSLLIQFAADPLQLLNHMSLFEGLYFLPANSSIFIVVDFGALLLYGGLLGLLIMYLLSLNHMIVKNHNLSERAADFTFRVVNAVIFIPALFTLGLFYLIAFAMTINPLVFPSYGEGTVGSLLVVSVLLSMYLGAKIMNNWENIHIPKPSMITSKSILKLLVEIIAVYTCTTAAFSIMGGLITDGTPVPLLLPFDYIILTLFLTVPYSLLLLRDRILPPKVDITKQNIELSSPISGIPLN